MTYTIIVKRQGQQDMIRTGVDKLNSVVIPADLKMAFPKQFESGMMSVEVVEEKQHYISWLSPTSLYPYLAKRKELMST